MSDQKSSATMASCNSMINKINIKLIEARLTLGRFCGRYSSNFSSALLEGEILLNNADKIAEALRVTNSMIKHPLSASPEQSLLDYLEDSGLRLIMQLDDFIHDMDEVLKG